MSTAPPAGHPEENTSGGTTESENASHVSDSGAPPAGWYPTPTGGQRYWDGEKWLALPAPSSEVPRSTDAPAVPKNRRSRKWALIAGGLVLLLGVIGGGIAWKVSTDARQEAATAAEAAERSAAEESEARASEAAAASAAQERRDETERDSRRATVTEIEASIKTMAEGHATDGIIDGPILEVRCSPVGGGSTDDLTEQTTVFECFVATEDNGDGTMSGYTYNATMNWSSGSYTYGLGAA